MDSSKLFLWVLSRDEPAERSGVGSFESGPHSEVSLPAQICSCSRQIPFNQQNFKPANECPSSKRARFPVRAVFRTHKPSGATKHESRDRMFAPLSTSGTISHQFSTPST